MGTMLLDGYGCVNKLLEKVTTDQLQVKIFSNILFLPCYIFLQQKHI